MLSSLKETAERIKESHFQQFGDQAGTPRIFRSPGRINLIGEHTDYNNGFVLPASVDKAVYFAISPVAGTQVTLFAVDLNETYTFSLDDLSKPERSWPHYQMGIIEQITAATLLEIYFSDHPTIAIPNVTISKPLIA